MTTEVLLTLLGVIASGAVSLAAWITIQINRINTTVRGIEEWRLSFTNYPRSGDDFREIVLAAVRQAIDPRLTEIERRLAILEARLPQHKK